MKNLIFLLTIISLGAAPEGVTNDDSIKQYFCNDAFSKTYLELNFENQTFTYSYYSCLSDVTKGTFKIKGDKLILNTTDNCRNRLGKFYFTDNGEKLVQKYRFGKHQYLFDLVKD